MKELPDLEDLENVVVMYHHPCRDGFASSFVLYTALGETAKYVPAMHGQPPAKISEDSSIIIADFCYPDEELVELAASVAGPVIVLDHHKTTAEIFTSGKVQGTSSWDGTKGILQATYPSNLYIYLDMNFSGVGLAWQYVNGDVEIHPALDLVQRKDLWKHSREDDEMVMAFDVHPKDFETWSWILSKDDCMQMLENEGRVIAGYRDNLISWDLKNVNWMKVLDKYTVPAVNTAQFCSDIAAFMCRKYSRAPFAMCWHLTRDYRIKLSLRSKSDFDVSEIAKLFGGGGHKNAAGAIISQEKFRESISEPNHVDVSNVLMEEDVAYCYDLSV